MEGPWLSKNQTIGDWIAEYCCDAETGVYSAVLYERCLRAWSRGEDYEDLRFNNVIPRATYSPSAAGSALRALRSRGSAAALNLASAMSEPQEPLELATPPRTKPVSADKEVLPPFDSAAFAHAAQEILVNSAALSGNRIRQLLPVNLLNYTGHLKTHLKRAGAMQLEGDLFIMASSAANSVRFDSAAFASAVRALLTENATLSGQQIYERLPATLRSYTGKLKKNLLRAGSIELEPNLFALGSSPPARTDGAHTTASRVPAPVSDCSAHVLPATQSDLLRRVFSTFPGIPRIAAIRSALRTCNAEGELNELREAVKEQRAAVKAFVKRANDLESVNEWLVKLQRSQVSSLEEARQSFKSLFVSPWDMLEGRFVSHDSMSKLRRYTSKHKLFVVWGPPPFNKKLTWW
jgi:hypothetical protein